MKSYTLTAKESHVGSKGRVAHFIAAWAYQKSVVFCEQYEGKINGDMFSDFINTHFQETFSRCRIPLGKGFFKIDMLYKTVKRQDKLWRQLEQSNLAYFLVNQILIL